jgi:quinol monooxygenase YgiN
MPNDPNATPSPLVIVARVRARPGAHARLVAAQAALVQVVRALPGCLQYDLFEDEAQPGRVIFFERWHDRAAWEQHMRGAHMDAFRADAGPLIGEFDLLQMRQVA